jgi:(p)ppGpp synthase/HD superfamily hydrolase
MINYTNRLDAAIRIAATAHREQRRKGSDTPYIIHPFGVMLIASNVTANEDTLIACLFHDIIEDVPKEYSAEQMRKDFGDKVLRIVLDVTKDENIEDWHERSKAYLKHLEYGAGEEAIIVSSADKIHNLKSVLTDYGKVGDKLWDRFSTKSGADQLWWYESILEIITKRKAPASLIKQLSADVESLRDLLK